MKMDNTIGCGSYANVDIRPLHSQVTAQTHICAIIGYGAVAKRLRASKFSDTVSGTSNSSYASA